MLLNIVFNGFTISFLGSCYTTNNQYTITDQSMQKYPLVGYYKKSIKECILNDIAHNSGWSLNVLMHCHSYARWFCFYLFVTYKDANKSSYQYHNFILHIQFLYIEINNLLKCIPV